MGWGWGLGGGREQRKSETESVSTAVLCVVSRGNDAVSVVGTLGLSRFELKQGLFRSQSL